MVRVIYVYRMPVFLVALLLVFVPFKAQSLSVTTDPLELFAQCAGRFEAERDFARVWDTANPEPLQRQHADFEDLVEATRTSDTRERAHRLKIQAKSAHLTLLWRAQFSTSQTEAQIALRTAQRSRQLCRSILPG